MPPARHRFASIVFRLAGDPFQTQANPAIAKGRAIEPPMRNDKVRVEIAPPTGRGLAMDDKGMGVRVGIDADLAEDPVCIGTKVVARTVSARRKRDMVKGRSQGPRCKAAHRGQRAEKIVADDADD
jgi:hypothetical protein